MTAIHIMGALEYTRSNSTRSGKPWPNGLYVRLRQSTASGPAKFEAVVLEIENDDCRIVFQTGGTPISMGNAAKLLNQKWLRDGFDTHILISAGWQKSMRGEIEKVHINDRKQIVFDHETVHSGIFPNWRQLMST